jgi:DHA1 family bicyclomycin/chloramphenicol resistance-like MFS transporter
MSRLHLVLLLGSLTALDPLTVDMYLPAFGDMKTAFATSMSHIELSVSTFFVGMAFGQLIYGPIADRFGRKKPLLAGMLLYLIATIGCMFAPTIELFIVSRFLQALGGCAGMVITRAIARDLFDKKGVAVFLSHMALVMGIAPIVAPTLGGAINEMFGWRAIFGTLALANISCLVAITFFLKETHLATRSSLRLGETVRTYGQLLKSPSFVGNLIPDTLIRAGMFAYITGSPFVFIELLGIPAKHYGLVFGLNGLGLMAASQFNRRFLNRWTSDQILVWSVRLAALTAIAVFASSLFMPGNRVLLVAIFFFLATLNFVSPNSLAGALAPQGHRAGAASALYGCLQWSMASVASFFVSHFHNGTAFPMTGVILFCGLGSFFAFQVLTNLERQDAV